jgi:hypothetical protein
VLGRGCSSRGTCAASECGGFLPCGRGSTDTGPATWRRRALLAPPRIEGFAAKRSSTASRRRARRAAEDGASRRLARARGDRALRRDRGRARPPSRRADGLGGLRPDVPARCINRRFIPAPLLYPGPPHPRPSHPARRTRPASPRPAHPARLTPRRLTRPPHPVPASPGPAAPVPLHPLPAHPVRLTPRARRSSIRRRSSEARSSSTVRRGGGARRASPGSAHKPRRPEQDVLARLCLSPPVDRLAQRPGSSAFLASA